MLRHFVVFITFYSALCMTFLIIHIRVNHAIVLCPVGGSFVCSV